MSSSKGQQQRPNPQTHTTSVSQGRAASKGANSTVKVGFSDQIVNLLLEEHLGSVPCPSALTKGWLKRLLCLPTAAGPQPGCQAACARFTSSHGVILGSIGMPIEQLPLVWRWFSSQICFLNLRPVKPVQVVVRRFHTVCDTPLVLSFGNMI